MIVGIDANVLSLIVFPGSSVPRDFRTGQPVDRAKERAQAILDQAARRNDLVLVATPILAEVLIPVVEAAGAWVSEFQNSPHILLRGFGDRAAIELAIRSRLARDAGNKRDGATGPWAKVKYDRQLLAIARVEGASCVYTTDEDVFKHAAAFGVEARHLADVQPDPEQSSLFPDPNESKPRRAFDFADDGE